LGPRSFRKRPGKHCTQGSPVQFGDDNHVLSMDANIAAHPSSELEMNATAADLSFLTEYSHVNRQGEYCISGCYPQHCWKVVEGGVEKYDCSTNCWVDLKMQLVYFYLLQVMAAVALLIIPIIITKLCIVADLKVVMKESNVVGAIFRAFTGQVEGTSSVAIPPGPLSYVQFQSRCHAELSYEYYSWGGSYVEDFLELVIGYAVLACFCQVVPEMAIVGLVCHLVIYRILAYRMLHVTSRPWPFGSEGLGNWSSLLDAIAEVAVACNVALTTFVMPPIASWPLETKLIIFIVVEKTLMLIRSLVRSLVKELPEDVVRIEDHNTKAKRLLRICSNAESEGFKKLFKVLVPTEREMKARHSVRSKDTATSNLGPPQFGGGPDEPQASEFMTTVLTFFSR